MEVFLKARKLFREEKVDVAFLPSYSPARFFALFAAATKRVTSAELADGQMLGYVRKYGYDRMHQC